jgi:uncharacterized protein (DUF58 family)
MVDPELLARVQHLHLRARVLTEAMMQGEHRSRRLGQAIEFTNYQEYLPGTDLRHLDWRVLGRTDRLVIKSFEMETELPITVVLDLSSDLATGAPGATGWFRRWLGRAESGSRPDLDDSKAGVAITLAATLLYAFHLHREPVGLEIVAGDGISNRSFPPRSGKAQIHAMFATLASVRPGGTADLASSLARVGNRVRRRSLVIVLSDGMEEPSDWLPSVAAFGRRHTDLRFIHLYDRREWGLEFSTPARLYSPEDGQDLAIDPSAAQSQMREVARAYAEEVRAGVAQWGGVYVPAPLDGNLENIASRAIRGISTPPGFDPFAVGGAS